MIPFWPPPGLGPRGLIDYTIQKGEGSGPCTDTTEEEVEQCMDAIRRRDAAMMGNAEFAGMTYRGVI